jgi:acetyltransferase-like isoleucine patch superfamily enzyme
MKFNNKNISVSPKAQIGDNVRIGDNTIIYDNVVIGDNSVIANDCVLGEPLNSYYLNDGYEQPQTVIGSGALIRSHCIIYAGSVFGSNFQTGHRVTIREKSVFGNNCSLGTLTDIQGYVKVGNYCRFHSNVHIGQNSEIGNFVFIYPYVVFTNDPLPPSNICNGPTVGDFTQIAVHSVILPGIKLGKHVLVGANSTVNKNVDDYSLVVGSPAKLVCDVRNLKSPEDKNKNHYPWPYSFERGMPWEGIGFDEWLKNSNND